MRRVDHTETYGRHVVAEFAAQCASTRPAVCLDVGCGGGADLREVHKVWPTASLVGIDARVDAAAMVGPPPIEIVTLNIEHEPLPFPDASIDLVVANQVFEHVKELFWINHEIFRVLKPGGHVILGVPNCLSAHNRVLGLFGTHPTTAKSLSAHVRAFSLRDTRLFYEHTAPAFASIRRVTGSQFYPFPASISRPLARAMPSLATAIFFLIEKHGPYHSEFLDWLEAAHYETNFFRGPTA